MTLAPYGGYEIRDATSTSKVTQTRVGSPWKGFGHARGGGCARLRKLWWHGLEHLGVNGLGHRDRVRLDELLGWADVVVTNSISGWSGSLWRRAARQHKPVVHIVRDYYASCPRVARFRNGRPCTSVCASCSVFANLNRRRSRRVDHVIHISDFVRELHRAEGFFANAEAHLAPNQPELFLPDAWRTESADDAVRVGYIGAATPEKGLDLLLRTLDREEFAHRVVLTLAGGARAHAEHIEVIRLGVVSPGELLGRVDLLAVPSVWWEPQGRVVGEAGLAGVPVVTTGRGGLAESIGRDAAGWIVPADDNAWTAFFRSLVAGTARSPTAAGTVERVTTAQVDVVVEIVKATS